MKPAGAGRLPPRVGVVFFVLFSLFFHCCPYCWLQPPSPTSSTLPKAALTPCSEPLTVSHTLHPNLLLTPGYGSAGMQLHSQGVQTLLGTCSPCSSSPAEPRNPSFPLPFCTLRFDVLCTPSSTITACPVRQTASLAQAEGRRWGISCEVHQRGSRGILLLLEAL